MYFPDNRNFEGVLVGIVVAYSSTATAFAFGLSTATAIAASFTSAVARRRRGANTLANRAVMLQGVSSMQHAVNTCIAVSYESGLTYEILLRLARSTQYRYSVGLVKSH